MPFQKGKSGNPGGRPPILDKELQSLLDGKRPYLKSVLDRFLSMSEKEMAFITETEAANMPLIESWIMKLVEKGHNTGDSGLLFKLMEAAYGPLSQPEALTAEQRLALSLYDQWKREQTAHLGPPRVDEDSQ